MEIENGDKGMSMPMTEEEVIKEIERTEREFDRLMGEIDKDSKEMENFDILHTTCRGTMSYSSVFMG